MVVGRAPELGIGVCPNKELVASVRGHERADLFDGEFEFELAPSTVRKVRGDQHNLAFVGSRDPSGASSSGCGVVRPTPVHDYGWAL